MSDYKASTMPRESDPAPDKIYLNISDEESDPSDSTEWSEVAWSEVTWSEEPAVREAVEYVRADILASVTAELDALLASFGRAKRKELKNEARLDWLLDATADQLTALPRWDRGAIDEAMQKEAGDE